MSAALEEVRDGTHRGMEEAQVGTIACPLGIAPFVEQLFTYPTGKYLFLMCEPY